MSEIVEKNLEKMIGMDKGGMIYLILRESFGGNAGTWEGLPCAGANFYYDQNIGEIIYFGNYQNVPVGIREKFSKDSFRIALNRRTEKSYRIVNYVPPNHLPEVVQHVLTETVNAYNQRYGFQLDAIPRI